jgi:hypothetical protein
MKCEYEGRGSVWIGVAEREFVESLQLERRSGVGSYRRGRARRFVKSVAKGAAKGVGRLARDTTVGVVTELASIVTLGFVRPPKRRR